MTNAGPLNYRVCNLFLRYVNLRTFAFQYNNNGCEKYQKLCLIFSSLHNLIRSLKQLLSYSRYSKFWWIASSRDFSRSRKFYCQWGEWEVMNPVVVVCKYIFTLYYYPLCSDECVCTYFALWLGENGKIIHK